MKRTWTIIVVRNVLAIFKWYETLLGQLRLLQFEEKPNLNAKPGQWNFALRDPDGY